MKIDRSRRSLRVLAVVAAASATLAACSSSGGAANSRALARPAGGTAPEGEQYTIAMVTHSPSGDTFWDKIQSGAQAAATQTASSSKYSNDAIEPGRPRWSRTPSTPGSGHGRDAGEPRGGGPGRGRRPRTPGIPAVAFNPGYDAVPEYGAKMYFGSDEDVAGQAVGHEANRGGRRREGDCVIQAQGSCRWRPGAPA